MPQIWPFKPQEQFTETLEWRTDVFRAKSAEQRIALRTAPRRTFSFSPILTDIHYSAARSMVRDATSFYVPDWTQRVAVGTVSPGSDVSISPDLTGIDLSNGDRAILWESLDSFEAVNLTIDSADNVTIDSVVNSYTNPYLMPLVEAKAPNGLNADRIPVGFNRVSIDFEVFDNDDLGATSYSQYRGHDVISDSPVISSGTFAETLLWPVGTLDNEVSTPSHLRSRDIPDLTFQMRWHVTGMANSYTVRQWLHSRRGMQKAFWLSSHGSDLTLAATIGASDTVITVERPTGMNTLSRTDFDIEVLNGGTSYYRRVTGVATNTTDTLDLTIDSSLGVEVANPNRISYLRCARFNADRIEIIHRAKGGMSVAVPCIEIPVP